MYNTFMKTQIIAYFSSLVSLAVLDYAWLSVMLKRFYSPRLVHLTADSPSYGPAVLFYILYAIGVIIFIVLPSVSEHSSFSKIFLLGALLGLVSYGAYDLTNGATLKNWPSIVSVVDMAWGATLTGLASMISVYITKIFA